MKAMLTLVVLAATQTAGAPAWEPAACASLGTELAELGAGVECGWIRVSTVRIPFVRARSLGPAQADPILYLHGGPGIATLDIVPLALRGKSWPLLRQDRDLVFFDQRGTGRSTPLLCPAFDAEMDRLERSKLSPEMKLERQLGAAAACREELDRAGIDPASYNSTSIASDAAALMTALGYERWNIFATSYGTLPATELARHYPDRIRSILLDSAFPPNSPNRGEQVTATAESFAAMQRHCDLDAGCTSRYGNLRALAAQAAKRLDESPLQVEGGHASGDGFYAALWILQVRSTLVPYIPEFLRRAAAGDETATRTIIEQFGGLDVFGGYSHAQSWLVNCYDGYDLPTAPGFARAREQYPDLAAQVPDDATDRLCRVLQPGRARANFSQPLATDVPVLVFFGEFDAATPRSDALAALTGPRRATLVDVGGASHAPFHQDDCTRSIGAAFIRDPAKPLDLACLGNRPAFVFADERAFDAFLDELRAP